MDKQQIIQTIKENSELSYEEVKKQALEAGVSEDDFEECWKIENRRSKKMMAFILLTIGTTALVSSLFASPATSLRADRAAWFWFLILIIGVPTVIFYAMLIYGNKWMKILAILIPFIIFRLLFSIMAGFGLG